MRKFLLMVSALVISMVSFSSQAGGYVDIHHYDGEVFYSDVAGRQDRFTAISFVASEEDVVTYNVKSTATGLFQIELLYTVNQYNFQYDGNLDFRSDVVWNMVSTYSSNFPSYSITAYLVEGQEYQFDIYSSNYEPGKVAAQGIQFWLID